MKKTLFSVLLLISAALLLPLGLSAQAKIKVGLSLPTQREERWVRDKATMEAYAKKMNIDLKVAVADADTAQQAQQVENLISQGIRSSSWPPTTAPPPLRWSPRPPPKASRSSPMTA